ncbi:MAG: AMP-binding protein [Proteobacteria bacterium]|nr:AMP-binding protein [Pseudomonadota bacterium]
MTGAAGSACAVPLGGPLEAKLEAFTREHGAAAETVVFAVWRAFLALEDSVFPGIAVCGADTNMVVEGGPCDASQQFIDLVVQTHHALRGACRGRDGAAASFHVAADPTDDLRDGADDSSDGRRLVMRGRSGARALAGQRAPAIRTALEAALTSPQTPLRALLFGPSGRIAGESAPSTDDQDLVAAFIAAARKQPDAPAVVTPTRDWTYGECESRVRSWAQGLRAGATVAVLSDDPLVLVCAPLAILAAGARFVMLDPTVPAARTARLIAVAGADVAIVSRTCERPDELPVLDPEVLDRLPPRMDIAEHAGHLSACLTFTSGSTGFPRACVMRRDVLRRLGRCLHATFGGTRLLRIGSIAFDAFLHDLSLAFGEGGTLFFPGDSTGPLDPVKTVALAAAWRIDHVCAVPSVLALFDPTKLCGERMPAVVSVGEPCPQGLETCFAGHARFFDAYGCTEAGVANLFALLDGSRARTGATRLRPLPGVTVTVIDSRLRPLPAGVCGELAVAGGGIGHGYVGSPRDTAARFVPDLWGAPGERLFLTGDWAKVESDGCVTLLGRLDRQVKVLGARVDLAELDRVALAQPGVAAAAAVATLAPTTVHLAVVDDPGHRRPALEHRRIAEWIEAFESSFEASGHGDASPSVDDDGAFVGWRSALTGQPIAATEMREWVDATCTSVLEGAPAAVLEIGCGTGAVLRRLAAVCHDVWGTDVSMVALRRAAARLRDPACTARVRLLEQAATDPVRAPRRFDVVLFSSVVQYFPSAAYLLDALRHAIAAVGVGGRVHVADVRDLRLAPMLHADISRRQPTAEFADDRELLVDPRFFLAAAAVLEGVRGIELLVRGGDTANELNTYRYDAVLHVGEAPMAAALPVIAWSQVADIDRIVAPVRIVGIPNARLRGSEGEDPVRLRRRFEASGQRAVATLDLEDPAAFELVVGARWCHRPDGRAGRLDWLASDPLRADRAAVLVSELDTSFQRELPSWMRPVEIRVVEQLPRTPAGKIDYAEVQALFDRARPAARHLPAKREVVADLLAGLWEDVLGHRPTVPEESFFAAGGHSLQAVRLMARLSSTLGVTLPLSTLFRNPSFDALLAAVESARDANTAFAGFRLELAPPADRYPMTTAQARVWFLEQLLPGTATYHLPVALRLTGALDVAALQRAFSMVVRRHEALRAAFGLVDGEPSQWFPAAVDVEVPLLADMRLDDEALEAWISAFGRRPFPLVAGGCFRAALLQLAPDRHVFVMVLHHLIADGWSMRVLASDLSRAYALCRDPRAAEPFAPLRFTYRDYAVSQHRWAASGTEAQGVDWWVERLRDGPPTTSLATRPRPSARSGRGETIERWIPETLVQRLRALAVASDATLYMVLLTAFAVLVARHGTDRDITIGTPVANRPDRSLDEMIGFFANTVALRLDVPLSATFRRLLVHVRETVVAAFDHQDCMFDRVVAALQPVRDLSITPVFQLWFAFLDMELLEDTIGDLRIEPVAMGGGYAQFDLSLALALTSRGLAAAFTYDAELFERSHVERMADRYSAMLEAFCAQPEVAVGDVALLTAAEMDALRDLASGGLPLVHSLGVSGRLAFHAAQRPDAIAVVDGDARCRYVTLDALVDRLAVGLAARADGQRPVGLDLPRSFQLLALVFAALRAGVPFVLLDPDHPLALREAMCLDAGVRCVIRAADWDDLTATQGAPRHPSLPGTALAYVCFTSGSTGRPKGVAVSRGALDAMLGSMARQLSAGPHTAMLALTALSFDIALLELLLPLHIGGRVVVSPPAGPFDAVGVLGLIESEAVNTVQCTPSVWRLLLAAGFEGAEDMVALSGGEVLPPDLAGDLLDRCGKLLNVYGPTEATVWSTVHSVAAGDLADAVPIGRPIGGTRCHVLDERRNPVPQGVIGELYLAGTGVAVGYIGRPAETALHFVPEPGGEPGARMYATGDLVCWTAGGLLHYIGRRDAQIKLRGVRMEPAGIERVLLGLDGIKDACVIVEGSGPTARLVACCVASDRELTLADVRMRAGTVLPVSMLPEQLVLVDALPRRPSGKRDLAALAALVRQQGRPNQDVVGGDVPAEVAALCAEIVGCPAVRAQDHFFADLGGHSLLALRLVEGLERRFGVQVPLRALFEHPTVAGISRLVARALEAMEQGSAT